MGSEPLFTCDWCREPVTDPGRNSQGELCPCSCHEGVEGWLPWGQRDDPEIIARFSGGQV